MIFFSANVNRKKMSINREKHANFFPRKVYRCPCLLSTIEDCYQNDLNSFIELHDEVWNFALDNNDIGKVFAVKCGEKSKDCIFCCEKHLSIIIFGKKKFDCTDDQSFDNLTLYYNESKEVLIGKTFCKGCIKHYLKESICYFYFKEF